MCFCLVCVCIVRVCFSGICVLLRPCPISASGSGSRFWGRGSFAFLWYHSQFDRGTLSALFFFSPLAGPPTSANHSWSFPLQSQNRDRPWLPKPEAHSTHFSFSLFPSRHRLPSSARRARLHLRKTLAGLGTPSQLIRFSEILSPLPTPTHSSLPFLPSRHFYCIH